MLLVRMYNQPILPREGKYSNIKNPKTCGWPVKIAIPVISKIVPPILAIMGVYLPKLLEKKINLLIKIPEIIKGIAKPNE